MEFPVCFLTLSGTVESCGAFGAAFERERKGGFRHFAGDAYAVRFSFGFKHNWSGASFYDISVCCSHRCNGDVGGEPERTGFVDESMSSRPCSVLARAMPRVDSVRASISTCVIVLPDMTRSDQRRERLRFMGQEI